MSSLHSFLKDYTDYDYSQEDIIERYVEWISEDTYMILSKQKHLNEYSLKGYCIEVEYFAVKCSKRGNDVYRYRVFKRFKGLSSKMDKISFFNPKNRGVKKTRALWVTLTYDTKRCSYQEAWINIGNEFNNFMAYIRKKFGKVSCCRVFESFANGYPHIHCILLFVKSFSVFRDSKGQFRIHEKEVLAKGWHSNIDVKAMSSLAGGLNYLKKYLLKGIDFKNADSKSLKTLALCWVFRKRAFSVSGQFRKALTDLIKYMHNSNLKML
jgi:hypothetical protein